jgi:hypothetical protein
MSRDDPLQVLGGRTSYTWDIDRNVENFDMWLQDSIIITCHFSLWWPLEKRGVDKREEKARTEQSQDHSTAVQITRPDARHSAQPRSGYRSRSTTIDFK